MIKQHLDKKTGRIHNLLLRSHEEKMTDFVYGEPEMNLTQFFDASITLQEYGYKIHFIDEEDETYGVTFAYADVCSGLAFGGVQYEIQFHKGSTQPVFLHKMVVRQLRMDFETTYEVHSIDEAVDFIIADIQKLQEEVKEGERQRVLAKLTQRERELLGV